MSEHSKHADESRRMHEARNVIPGSPLDDRLKREGIEIPPEIMANRGLFADSGGAYED